jgi:hypothetical protein
LLAELALAIDLGKPRTTPPAYSSLDIRRTAAAAGERLGIWSSAEEAMTLLQITLAKTKGPAETVTDLIQSESSATSRFLPGGLHIATSPRTLAHMMPVTVEILHRVFSDLRVIFSKYDDLSDLR